jgi:hypothetical protein
MVFLSSTTVTEIYQL